MRIESLTYGGDALGRDPQGRIVFVPYAIPGETVRVELTESRRNWARARLIEILDPAPARTTPRCRHFKACGGCHYQHISYEEQISAKREILREQLRRIGGLQQPPVKQTIPSASPWNYRNHMRFQVGPNGRLGFYAASDLHNEVLEIEQCHLPEPAISELWPKLEINEIPDLHAVGVRVSPDGEPLIVLYADSAPKDDVLIQSSGSIAWSHSHGWITLAGEGGLTFEVSGRLFRVSAPSFFQIHSGLTEQLIQLVLDGLAVSEGDLILDLYAGVGLFSAFAAAAGANIIAVEESAWACADFEVNLNEFGDVALYEAPVEDVIPHLQVEPVGAILDPPRRGLDQAVIEALAQLRIARLVYVSCDPATLARDAKRFTQVGYELVSATPIDLFPQTYHIESVSLWQRVEA